MLLGKSSRHSTFTGANVNGGLTFTLRYNGRDTAPIAFTAAMTTHIKSAIEGLETFYGGTIIRFHKTVPATIKM